MARYQVLTIARPLDWKPAAPDDQPPEPVALLEVLVDDHARQHPEARRDLGHPVFRRRSRRPERAVPGAAASLMDKFVH